MNKDNLEFFKKWFSRYCQSHYSLDSEFQKNIIIKESHSYSVSHNIVRIAREYTNLENDLLLAEAIGLLHDIGRFQQYTRYKTFKDNLSVNHGFLGAKIIMEGKILHHLPLYEQKIIYNSVKFHNAFSIPDLDDARMIFFLKLVRDADKIDIYRVFINHFTGAKKLSSVVFHNLLDNGEYSKNIVSNIYNGKMVSLYNVKTLNDFKLLQISWVFDFNFRATLRLLQERKYIEKILSTLPQDYDIQGIGKFIKEYIMSYGVALQG